MHLAPDLGGLSDSDPPVFLCSQRGFASKKGPFLPPLALLGSVPLPTFCS